MCIPVKRIFIPKFDQLGSRIQIKFNSQTLPTQLNQPGITIEYIPSIARDQLNAVCRDTQSFDPANRVNESRIKSVCWDRTSLDPDQGEEDEPVCRDKKSLDPDQQQVDGAVRWGDCPLDPAIQEEEQDGIKQQQNHQIQTKWQIGGRLIHFLDIWKLIKAESPITKQGAAGRNSRVSVSELTEINQSLLYDTEDGSGKKEKDNRLLSIEQTSCIRIFHNGIYSKSLTITATYGLYDKDRSGVRVSPHPSGQGFQTIPRIRKN
ncbi:MAG: hypothetical protein EZS28_032496 [Streblomastix strix]|uniref:Uncharacterized protein n=1 Tax=Streblomastix strix TaxID=222440 RepID=A0A5J4UNI5_9EUKA|nr:MAG: hypothetical protein EZS28_032496 [Streblomastix strix]